MVPSRGKFSTLPGVCLRVFNVGRNGLLGSLKIGIWELLGWDVIEQAALWYERKYVLIRWYRWQICSENADKPSDLAVPSGNQTWQWKMDHWWMILPLKPPFIGDFPLPSLITRGYPKQTYKQDVHVFVIGVFSLICNGVWRISQDHTSHLSQDSSVKF